MSVSTLIAAFTDGFRSVVDIPSLVKNYVGHALEDTVEAAFERIRPALVQVTVSVGLLLAGTVLLSVGIAHALEVALKTAGLGYALAGIILLAGGIVALNWGRKK